jgi:nucleotidyltransferase substrate binding protein (TIGR01987 family)
LNADFHKNFETALNKLVMFSAMPLKDDLDKAGLIQGFEFTFEQCWKAIQKASGSEGVRIASPKPAFTWALEKGWIPASEERVWLDMLEDRNLTTQTYREEIAHSVVKNIKASYVSSFQRLLVQIK